MASQRTVRFPLDGLRLKTGFTALKAVISLQVRNQHHQFPPIEFHVDSGTNVTSIAIAEATMARLMVPAQAIELEVRTAMGKVRQQVHAGIITVRVSDLEGRNFLWPCHFVEHEGDPPQALLGLSGVLNDLDIGFTGDYALEARYGWLVLEERS